MFKFSRRLVSRVARPNFVYRGIGCNVQDDVVSIAEAKMMPRHYNEMAGEIIVSMAINGTVILTHMADIRFRQNREGFRLN
jgi:hypothetical protein